ncbi:putative ribonuclease H-like domain-containing protein, partial [Tanacetum coccineum]
MLLQSCHFSSKIIEDGNSFKPVARTTTNADGTSTSTIPGAVTAEEKIQKKNDLKAQSILMMILPSDHLLTFNQYKDAKTLFEATEARFGGNEATKKTQKTLLKQMYENFNASSSESLDSIFTRLQKIVSQLAILGENISQEDLNFKFLRIHPSEWSMHVVVWRNKPDLGLISFDDLYNNFKIVGQEVKRSVISSSNSSSQNVAFVSTPSSTNDVNTSNVHASTTDNTTRLSDSTIYAFLANQPNGSQVVHEDLEQIHEDDLEEMDLKCDIAGYDKTKVECFNCHKMGHSARECRNPRSQENRSINQDSSMRTVNVEESSSKAMLAIDGVGFDWSFMTKEKIPTNFALMAFSDSEVHNYKTCSKTCLKSFKDLKSQYDNLRIELNKSKFDLANYKRGLASVEEQLVFYKKNEGVLCDQIVILKRDASFNELKINALKIQIERPKGLCPNGIPCCCEKLLRTYEIIERLKKEKESNQIKIDNFENASKSLDKLIGCQIFDNNRKGMGYNAVAPPPTGLFAPPTIDLSNSGLEEFKQPEFEGYGVKVNKSVSENSSNEIKKTSGAPIIEDWVSDCDEDETLEKLTPKACFVCGSFNHLIKDYNFHDKKMVQKPVLNNVKKGTGQREVRPVWNNAMRTNHQNFFNSRRNFAPTAVLTKSGLVPISTARQNSLRATTSVNIVKPIKTVTPKSFVNVAKDRPNVNSVNTAKGKRVKSAVGEQGINAVKSKACWVWRPKIKVLDHVSKNNGSYICKQFDYVDPTGLEFKVLVVYHTTNGHQFTMSNRQERIGYSRANDNWISKIDCLLSSEVGDEAVHKELGDRMERAATTASSFKTKQDSGGYTPRSDEGSKKFNDLTEMCTKLSEKVTSLEQDLKQTKKVYGKARTKLGKKGQTFGRSTQVYNKEEKGKEIEHAKEVNYIRRRSTDSLKVSTAGDLFSTAEEFLNTDEEIAQKVRDITVAYQSFEHMLKEFDREDLVALWSLVKERFRSAEPTEDIEKALWVELKRLFKLDKDDVLWKLQRYMHDPLTWRLYGACGVHHISSTRGHDIYMLTVKKNYPLSTTVMGLMLGKRLQVEED